MKRIVLLSLTPREVPGGVARWVSDFFQAFPDRNVVHYNINDVFSRFGYRNMNEWDAASVLGQHLVKRGIVNKDDIFIADGFWGIGLEPGPNVISVCHGTWARRVKADLDKGIPSEFPNQMKVQELYWKKLVDSGGKIVAVSEFAQDDLKNTWKLPSDVINNAIDLKKFGPRPKLYREKPLIIHGVTSKVKAIEHIEYLKLRQPNYDILLLDEAAQKLNMPKYEALAQADAVVIPSHYEGNSYFTLEALACDVPVVCYDVGMPWWAFRNGYSRSIGNIISYDEFSMRMTYDALQDVLAEPRENLHPRELANVFPLERFRSEWKTYLDGMEK